jgi:Arc/MetJ-type ribon-helix-helix transcriptional regulator
MDVAQVRLPEGLMNEVDELVNQGLYTNRSEVIRDALRKLILKKQVGSITNQGNSVKEVRKIRKKLSKGFGIDDIKKINSLGE